MTKEMPVLLLLLALIIQPCFADLPVNVPAVTIFDATTNKAIESVGQEFVIPYALEITIDAGQVAWPEYETNLVEVEHGGGIIMPGMSGRSVLATYEKLGGITAANKTFLKNNYTPALGSALELETQRAAALEKLKLAKLFTENGTKAFKKTDLVTDIARSDLLNSLKNIASMSDDAVVRADAGNLLASLQAAPQNADGFFNVLKTVGFKSNRGNTSPVTYLTSKHTALTNKLKTTATELTNARFETVVDDVYGLSVKAADGSVLSVPKLSGVGSIDDIGKVSLAKGFKISSAASGNAAKAGAALEAVRTTRLSNLQAALARYEKANRLTRGHYAKALQQAVKEAQVTGLEVAYEGGFVKALQNGTVVKSGLRSTDDLAGLVGKSSTTVSKSGVLARISQKIGQSSIAQSKAGQVIGKYGGKTLSTGGKVLKAGGVYLGVPASIVKGAAYGFCKIEMPFAPPTGSIKPVIWDKRERFPEYERPNQKALSVFYQDTDFEYEIYQNTNANIDRVKSCLKEAYETKGYAAWDPRKYIIGVSEFFNTASLVEDVAYWVYSPSLPVERCVWRIYSDRTDLGSISNFKKLFSCELDKRTTVDSTRFPEGRYVVMLFAQYSDDMLALLEDTSNPVWQKLIDPSYTRYGLACADYLDCARKYGDAYGIVPLVITVLGNSVLDGWIGIRLANLPNGTSLAKTIETLELFTDEELTQMHVFEKKLSSSGDIIYIKPEGLTIGLSKTFYVKVRPKDASGKDLDFGGKLTIQMQNLQSQDLEEAK